MSKTALNWINGEWIDSGSHKDSINPATGKKIGVFADGGQAEAERAIAVAKAVFFRCCLSAYTSGSVFVQLVLRELGIASVLLAGILIGVIISTCMVYFAMPLTLKLFKEWLKPDN